MRSAKTLAVMVYHDVTSVLLAYADDIGIGNSTTKVIEHFLNKEKSTKDGANDKLKK